MIGITISADQLRTAPAAVRQWIEGELAAALAAQPAGAPEDHHHRGLAVCSAEEVSAVFSLIQNMVPAVSVFLELGHQGVSVAGGAMDAYRLSDLMAHARLDSADQLMALLSVINGALQRIRGSSEVSLYGLDGRGHCFVASQTRQNINDLWKRLVSDAHGRGGDPAAPSDENLPAQGPAPEIAKASQPVAETEDFAASV